MKFGDPNANPWTKFDVKSGHVEKDFCKVICGSPMTSQDYGIGWTRPLLSVSWVGCEL